MFRKFFTSDTLLFTAVTGKVMGDSSFASIPFAKPDFSLTRILLSLLVILLLVALAVHIKIPRSP